jgi:hypothetical protein
MGNKRKYREGVGKWLEREIGVKVNVREAFKINQDKMKVGSRRTLCQIRVS